ncbi:MAG: hypothetical protein Ct9H300mP28_02120 [Pseudomonadota bacterium]|nr:MAG: hypothetical protein Ct9H300mP28_02120 [Pseudomonadota bacterium]
MLPWPSQWEYQAPRDLVVAIPGAEFMEMYRCREQSYCCGGGGGGMWLEGVSADHTRERLSENRVREAVEIGAEVLVVCVLMRFPLRGCSKINRQ